MMHPATSNAVAEPQVKLTPEWRSWVDTNLRRRCTAESLVKVMVANRFAPDLAAAVITVVAAELEAEEVRAGEAAEKAQPTQGQVDSLRGVSLAALAKRSHDYYYEPSRLPAGNAFSVAGRNLRVLMRVERPEVVLLEGVLSPNECAELRELSAEKLARSTIVDPLTGKGEVIESRSSFGTFFSLRENALVAEIDERLAQLMNWPVEKAEGLQVLRYQAGGEYKPHFDYFPPQNVGSAVHTALGGQRLATLVLYLNDVPAGGETIFPEIGLAVAPRCGCAAYFSYFNTRGQVNPLTLHGGAPVREGEKWIATKWLRQFPRA